MFQGVNLQCGSFKGVFMLIENTCLRTQNCGDVSEIMKANFTCDFAYITDEDPYLILCTYYWMVTTSKGTPMVLTMMKSGQ